MVYVTRVVCHISHVRRDMNQRTNMMKTSAMRSVRVFASAENLVRLNAV